MGAAIEKIVGEPLSAFMRKEIFEPLEMEDTGFFVPEEKRKRLAATYASVLQKEKRTMERYEGNHLAILNDMRGEPAFVSGGAGLVSTLDDYLHFARMLLQGGIWNGQRILQKKNGGISDAWKFVGKPAAGNGAVDRTGRVYLCKFYAEMCGT